MLLTLVVMLTSLHADTELPEEIRTFQAASVADHGCESDWTALLEENGTRSITIDAYTRLIAVPCARWSLNLSYRVYAEFSEPQKLYERLGFANLDSDGAIVASDEIYNAWTWNEDRRELTSTNRFDANLDCGSRTVYRWDAGKLRFVMSEVYLKTACDRRPTAWPRVPLCAERGVQKTASPNQ